MAEVAHRRPHLTAVIAPETPYRRIPQNAEAEQALLGAILVNNEAALKVSSFLHAEHFVEPVHSRIYDAAMKLIERGHLADPLTLKGYFDRDDALAAVGGAGYLAQLAAAATTIINAEDYGRAIYDLALRRQLITIGEGMVNTAYDAEVDETAVSQIEAAERHLFTLAQSGETEGGFKSFTRASTLALENAEAAYKREGQLSGVTTGFADLDKALGGLHRSDLLILAGRPSMGKTALATNIAFNAARSYREEVGVDGRPTVVEGAAVAFFSLEMSAEQLATRILAEQSNIPSERIRRGTISSEQFTNLARAAQELERLPMYIDDTPALSIAALATRARRLKRTHNIGMIVVDYLQLVRPARQRRDDNRVLEVSEITQGLKALAKQLDVPVLALSQLSRAVEQREDKRPHLADLRESGSIEQDADVVMFIYREEYYLERLKPAEGTPERINWDIKRKEVEGIAEVIIGKHRHGPTGSEQLLFHGETTKFATLARASHLPPGASF